MQVLIDCGGDISFRLHPDGGDFEGVFTEIVDVGMVENMQWLLAKEGCPDLRKSFGLHLVHMAVERADPAMVNALMLHGAAASNCRNYDGKLERLAIDARFYSVEKSRSPGRDELDRVLQNRMSCIRKLVHMGVFFINARDDNGWTPLDWAFWDCDLDGTKHPARPLWFTEWLRYTFDARRGRDFR